MPDQLEHALRRQTELLASRSKAEVAAISGLERAYELLLSRDCKTSCALTPGRIRRPQSARVRPSTPVSTAKRDSLLSKACPASSNEGRESSQGDGVKALETYALLVQLIGKLNATATELEAEVAGSERKCRALQLDPSSFLPPVDPSELSPRLQVLHSVLGHQRFQRYTRDLYTEVSQLRKKARLYGGRYRRFIQEIATANGKTVSSEAIGLMLQQWDCDSSSDPPAFQDTHARTASSSLPPLVVQHCGDAHASTCISIDEFDRVLCSLPGPREKLVRHTFEQLADGWRGEGYALPPDSLRAHRLHSIVKESFANQQCSAAERDAVAAWIDSIDADGAGAMPVSLRAFLEFHCLKSDEFALEDAEFVRYLLRIWCFDLSASLATAPRTDRDAVARVILNSDERSINERLMARKRELLGKIESALSGIESRAQHLRVHLGALERLEVKAPTVSTWWGDSQFAEHLGSSLAALRALIAPGYSLPTFPAFFGSLSRLEALELRDNRLAIIPRELGQLVALRRLDLSANCLTDASFAHSTCAWGNLKSLRELLLQGNRLTCIPEQVGEVIGLLKLDVSDNAIRRISKVIIHKWSAVSTLISLDLHHNALSSLPEEIGLLRQLQQLLLHDNELTSLPPSLASLTKLEGLTLTGNRLGNELDVLPVTDAQKHINLDRNVLREFPRLMLANEAPSSSSSVNVVSISVANNQLRGFPTLPVTVFAACKVLHLEHNGIRELFKEFFEALPRLEEIILHHNRLGRVPDTIVACKFLRVVDLHANQITEAPAAMVELSQLEVLDLTDNALQTIPVDWHGFSKHSKRLSADRRVLQTLALRRNPIRNSVLKAVVDGGSRYDARNVTSALSSESDRLCTGLLRKLIAGLRDAATTNAAFHSVATDSEEDNTEYDEVSGRRKWCGVTRDVNRYLVQRLRAMSRQSSGDGTTRLMVEAKSFERMIKSLPFACSKIELASLIARLMVSNTEGKQQLDGDAFLASVDSFGRSGTLSPAALTSPSRSRAETAPDSVAPILHYLSIMHRQRQSRRDSKRERLGNEAEGEALYPPTQSRKEKKPGREQSRAPKLRMPPSPAKKTSKTRQEAATNSFVARVRAPNRKSELERHRQRVEVLKQQLMDQKLTILGEPKHASASPISSAAMDANADSDSEATDKDQKPNGGAIDCGSGIVCVRVSLPATESTRLRLGKRHLDVRIGATQSVLELKKRIEALTRVPVGDQILIARIRGRPIGVRLSNASSVQQCVGSDYHTSEKEPWSLLLLIAGGV